MSAELDGEIADVLAKLGPAERKAVLAYARTLQGPDDNARPSLLDLVGTISRKDLDLMREAIEEQFERV